MHYVKCDGCGKDKIKPEDAAELDMKSDNTFYWEGQLCDKCASNVSNYIASLSDKETKRGE